MSEDKTNGNQQPTDLGISRRGALKAGAAVAAGFAALPEPVAALLNQGTPVARTEVEETMSLPPITEIANQEALETYLRSNDLPNTNYLQYSEDDIRGKRGISVDQEGRELVASCRLLIADKVWQRLRNNENQLGCTAQEWLFAHYEVANQIMQDAGIPIKWKLEGIGVVNDELLSRAGSAEVLDFASDGGDTIGKWREALITDDNKHISFSTKDDNVSLLSSGMTGQWPLTDGGDLLGPDVFVKALGKTIRMRGDYTHEIGHALKGLGVGDAYVASGDVGPIAGVSLRHVENGQNDLYGDGDLVISKVSSLVAKAILRLDPNWRGTQSDKAAEIPAPWSPNLLIDNPYLIFSKNGYIMRFVDKNNNPLPVDQTAYMINKTDAASDPIPFANTDTQGLPPGSYRFKSTSCLEVGDPEIKAIHTHHIAYKIGNKVILLPRIALNLAALSEKSYRDPNWAPEFIIQLTSNQIPDHENDYIFFVEGEPKDQPGVYAKCKIPGYRLSDGSVEDAWIVWSTQDNATIQTKKLTSVYIPNVLREVAAGQAQAVTEPIDQQPQQRKDVLHYNGGRVKDPKNTALHTPWTKPYRQD